MVKPENERANMRFIGGIVMVASIGGFMFGYDSGVINGTQTGLEAAFHLDRLGIGINVGSILIGSSAGAFVAARLADVMGRRGVMRLAAVLFVLSALLAGSAAQSITFIVARVIGGLGVGAASVISPVYISEVAPSSLRGRLTSLQQVMIIAGLTGAFLINYLLAQFAGGSTASLWFQFPAWRWMFWLQALPAAIYFAALLGIPESSRYLIMRGRHSDASNVLVRLVGAEQAQHQFSEIERSFATDHHQPRFTDLIDPRSGRVRQLVWAALGLAIFQQLVGINVVFYYGSTLWQAVGFSESDALKTNVLSGFLSMGSCLVAIALIDRIGRRPLLLVGSAGMAATLCTVGLAFSTVAQSTAGIVLPDSYGVLALVAANLYVVFFNLSWGPVMWVMLGEMFPNQIRGPGLAVAGFAQWMANALVSVSFPTLALRPGLAVTYLGYALCALLSFIFVRAFVHETRGRPLEQMMG